MANKKPIDLAKDLNEYVSNYKKATGRAATHIMVTPDEFLYVEMLIAQYQQENPSDETTYYEFNKEDSELTILIWKGAEIFEHPEAKTIRDSIKK